LHDQEHHRAVRRLKRLADLALAAFLVTPAALAEVASSATVLVLGAEESPLTGRLRAEIEALGLRVVSVDGRDASPSDLAERARTAGAAVAVSTTETRAGVDLWLVDRVTGKTLLREVLVRDLSNGDPDSVIALRAVELLRASLLELELGHPPRGEVTVTPDVLKTVGPTALEARGRARHTRRASERGHPLTESEDALLAGVGASVLAHLGQAGIVPGVTAAAFWQPNRRVAVGPSVTVPLRSSNVRADEGSAEIWSSMFGLGFRIAPLAPGGVLEPSLGLGGSALFLHIEGVQARPDLATDTAQLVAAGPYGEVGCALRIVRALTLRVDFRALAAFPRPIVEFVGREVASLGRPFVALTFGLEYRAVLSASRD
jgi:hypothetical protein